MTIITTTQAGVFTIKPEGRFTFSIQKEFRSAYESSDKIVTFVVDFLRVDYIDSAALGMLLILKEYADEHNAKVTLANCNSGIKSILEISNFHKIFTIT